MKNNEKLKLIFFFSNKYFYNFSFCCFFAFQSNENEAGTKKSVFVQKLSFPSPPSWSGLIFSTGLICRLVWVLLTPTRWDAQDEFECPKVWKFENGDQRKSSYTKMLVLLLRFSYLPRTFFHLDRLCFWWGTFFTFNTSLLLRLTFDLESVRVNSESFDMVYRRHVLLSILLGLLLFAQSPNLENLKPAFVTED